MLIDKPYMTGNHWRMTGNPKTIRSVGPGGSARPFIQPLAVALVSLVLVSLALVTGLVDLRSLDKTLTGYMEKRGEDIIRNVQQAAKYNFQLLGRDSPTDTDGAAPSGLAEETFSLRETLILDLLELAQKIDFDREQGRIDDNNLASVASGQGIWLIVLLDARGKITYKNRPFSESLLESVATVISGEDGIGVDLFDMAGHGRGMRLFAIRRKWGKGTIVLVLDQAGFRFWMARVSVERAVGEVGLGTDIGYFVVTDAEGRILFQTQETGTLARSPELASDREGERTVDVAGPFRLDGDPAFTARLGLFRENADHMLQKEAQRGIVFTGFMVFIAILSMWFLYRNQRKHLTNMREMERRLNRAERLSAMGRLAAGVAHEIRNPLNAISMACQRLQKDNIDQLTGIIRDEVRRLNHIIEEFIGLSRSGTLTLKANDLIALMRQMALLVAEEAASLGIALETEWPESPVMIWIDADKIKQALFNVIKNAMESIPNQGTVTLGVVREGKRWVMVRISDTGIGLTREAIEQIFDPDYTTKEKGLGLGLALVHEIIQAHNGEIRVLSEPGKGTTFEILLPVGGERRKG
ncbi:MAG: hypothetical protein JRL30_07550 [Deltaproteobacteria bacterium]|nr:hypothetical protein [Deltaproteobacteria bacterium]